MAMPMIANAYEIEAIIRSRLDVLINSMNFSASPEVIIAECDRIKGWAMEMKKIELAQGADERTV